MDDMGEEAVVEVEFFQHLLQIKIFAYNPRIVPFDLVIEKLLQAGGIKLTPYAYQLFDFSLHNF